MICISEAHASYVKGPDYFLLNNSNFPYFSVLLLFNMKFGTELENDQYLVTPGNPQHCNSIIAKVSIELY